MKIKFSYENEDFNDVFDEAVNGSYSFGDAMDSLVMRHQGPFTFDSFYEKLRKNIDDEIKLKEIVQGYWYWSPDLSPIQYAKNSRFFTYETVSGENHFKFIEIKKSDMIYYRLEWECRSKIIQNLAYTDTFANMKIEFSDAEIDKYVENELAYDKLDFESKLAIKIFIEQYEAMNEAVVTFYYSNKGYRLEIGDKCHNTCYLGGLVVNNNHFMDRFNDTIDYDEILETIKSAARFIRDRNGGLNLLHKYKTQN